MPEDPGRDASDADSSGDASDSADAAPEASPAGAASDAGSRATSRRGLLRMGVNVAAGAAVTWGVAADHGRSGRTRQATYALARPSPDADGLEPRTREVPAAWYRNLQLAFDVQERVHDADLPAVVGSSVVPGSYDDPQASLAVEATAAAAAAPVASLTDDVPVDLSVLDELSPWADEGRPAEVYRAPSLDAGSLTGGVACRSPRMVGTLAPTLFDAADGSRYVATSNHLFGASGTKRTAHRGVPLEVVHEDGETRIGTVERGFPLADVALVEPTADVRPVSSLDRASPRRVHGQYTRVGLADLKARGEPLVKVGAASGRTTGQITGVNGLTCFSGEVCKPGQLRWGDEETITDGDSGSVNFRPDPEHPDEGVLVGGVNNARTWWPGGDFAWGTAAHHLLDEYGLHF